MVILVAGLAAVFWIVLNPDLINNVESLSARLMYTNNPEAIPRIMVPYLFNPFTIGAGLLFFSVLIPIIEEILKPLGVWLHPQKRMTPRQGFALGVLGGAAYDLVESLGMAPGIPEASNLLSIVRAGTDLVPVVTTGLMGWALISAWREKKYVQLGITYLLVIVLHGMWNALALSSAAQIAIDYLPNPSRWIQSLPGVSVIALVALSVINRAESQGIGRTVLDGVIATHERVATNTNLGILLLIVPLAVVPRAVPLHAGVADALAQCTADDARLVYQAIRHAHPGGLGRVKAMDVHETPPDSLLDAMRAAADRDLVARQFVTNFADVFDRVVPWLVSLRQAGASVTDAIIHTQLRLLSVEPDSLIVRKCGIEVAQEASRFASIVDGSNSFPHG